MKLSKAAFAVIHAVYFPIHEAIVCAPWFGASGGLHGAEPSRDDPPMTVTITIQVDNAAFHEADAAGEPELKRIATLAGERAQAWVDHHYDAETGVLSERGSGALRDLNGNTVGRWEVEP